MTAPTEPSSPRRVKLRPPRMPEDAIARPRLLARLNRMAALSLVVAPAGYGKTTLVGTWLVQTAVPHAWLSLDEGDNDPAVFLTSVTQALATIAPGFGIDILAALDSPQAGIFADLAVLLINQLNEITDDFILVLDDYHLIHAPAIHQLLIDLVTYPPRAMHLVLTSRHDPPLPWRIRTRSNLCELRAADLGFTDEEGAQFLSKATERPVGPADAHTLVQKSQGWITSLRLMALAQRLHAPNTPIPEMTSARAFGDYFNQEVLSDLPADLLSFLVRTSILDLLSGPLCDFVVGTGDENSQQAGLVPGGSSVKRLHELVAAGAFTEALDDEGTWYRYHPLLREVLRRRLAQTVPPDEIAGLYARASAWHENHTLLDEALAYAIAGGQIQPAAEFVQRHRQQILNKWEWGRLERWLQQFPPAATHNNIELLLTRAWTDFWRYRLTDVRAAIERVEALAAVLEPSMRLTREWQGEVAALRAAHFLAQGDSTGAINAAEVALAALSPTQFYMRSTAMLYLMFGCQMAGDWQRVLAYSNAFAADAGAPRDLVLARTLVLRAYLELPATKLPATHTSYATMLQLVSTYGLKTNIAWTHYFWAVTSYLQNDLHAAEEHFGAVVKAVDSAHALAYTHSAIGLALTYQAQGRPQEAVDTIESALKNLAARQQDTLQRFVEAFAAELAARQGRIEEALRWVARAGSQYERDATPLFYVPGLAHVRVLLAGGTPGNLLAAKSWLEAETESAQRTHNVYALIQCHALAAALYDAQGRRHEALAILALALELAEHGQIVRVFVDLAAQLAPQFTDPAPWYPLGGETEGFVARVRNAMLLEHEAPTTAAPPAAGRAARSMTAGEESMSSQGAAQRSGGERNLQELLTYREMDVLRLLEQRLTNKEIAHELGISTETVRQHTVNLFRKLNVGNRRQAIVAARSMGYIGLQAAQEGVM